MYLTGNLIEKVFDIPYYNGYRNIKILSGYSSAAFLCHILNCYPKLNIELTIGMASKDGIRRADHEQFTNIVNKNSNVTVKYHKSLPSIHTKIYHWFNEDDINDSTSFIGSSNFSWNGFRDQIELMAEVNFSNIEDILNSSDGISCKDPTVEEYIQLTDIVPIEKNNTNTLDDITSSLTKNTPVKLPLLLKGNNKIHERSGLNWGQREGREPNQAYIPVPIAVHKSDPDFFPPYKHPFTLITDDGESFICVMSQAKRKAIETSFNNSILGKYFRKRLLVTLGEKVEVDDILNYGRTYVEIYKIDSETYFLNFGHSTLS